MSIVSFNTNLQQIFHSVKKPLDLNIPLTDIESWFFYPKQNWVYNRMLLCKSQNINVGPHGAWPFDFPIYSKSITNLMSKDDTGFLINNIKKANNSYTAGHFWMEHLNGKRTFIDIAIENGEAVWWANYTLKDKLIKPSNLLLNNCIMFIDGYLKGYSGMLKILLIAEKIINVSLNFNTNLISLYGESFLQSVVNLQLDEKWTCPKIKI